MPKYTVGAWLVSIVGELSVGVPGLDASSPCSSSAVLKLAVRHVSTPAVLLCRRVGIYDERFCLCVIMLSLVPSLKRAQRVYACTTAARR